MECKGFQAETGIKLDYERLINQIGIRFIDINKELFETEINNSLEQIGVCFGFDRIYYYCFSEDGTIMNLTYEWCRNGINSKRRRGQEELAYEFPWMMRKIKNNEVLVIRDITELPEEAVFEKEILSEDCVKSCLIIPMKVEGKIWGFMGFDSIRHAMEWEQDYIDTLKLLGKIFFSSQVKIYTEERLKSELYGKSLILDNSDVQIWSLKNTSVYGAVNDAHARFFGKNKADLEYQNVYDIFPQETANLLCRENWDLFRQNGETARELWIKDSNGDNRLLLMKSKPKMDSQGNIEYLVCTAEDITEQRRVQDDLSTAKKAAEAANIAKSQFFANMSHEIRTPMNGIIGFMELLERTGLTHEQQEYVREVNNASQVLLYLINDILNFSKIEAGKLSMEAICFDLRTIVESAVMLSVPKAYAKGLEMYTIIKSNVPFEAIGDPERLGQVLNNLISNSVKFTEKGEVQISVETIGESEDSLLIKFEVCDTGIGIAENDLEKLFNPFSQVDASTTRKYGGTGLGLAISQKLVELMGGKISVTSKYGEGSRFSFTSRFKKITVPRESAKNEYKELKGRKLMVADVNNTARKLVRNYLEEVGCIIEEAENGIQAINKLMNGSARSCIYNAVIISDQTPDINAYELAKALRTNHSTKTLALVLSCAFTQKGEIIAAGEKGYNAVLARPIKRKELLDCVNLLINPNLKEDKRSENGNYLQGTVALDNNVSSGVLQRKPKILLVEDNEVNRKLAVRMLEVNNLGCDVAVNGREAFEACKEKEFDIVLMDCQMPEMDGYQATTQIRDYEEGRRHTIIVAMTANAMEGDREKCLNAGMDDYISKPIRSKNLLSIIDKYCIYS